MTASFTGDLKPPDLSLVIPCYNEAASVRNTAVKLIRSLRETTADFELILVNNGSADNTGDIIDELITEGLPVVLETVEVNQGYGYGVLRGLRRCRGKIVGFMCADGQIAPQDVARLFEVAAAAKTPKLFKVRRRFRMDGWKRQIVSTIYNLTARALLGNLGTMDINANPKLLPREYLERMNLQSKDWFLDAEVMLKCKQLGLEVFELNVLGQMRLEGVSQVRPAAVWEFIVNLLKYRFSQHRGILPPQTSVAGKE